MINLLEKGVDRWMLTPMLTQKMDLQFFHLALQREENKFSFHIGILFVCFPAGSSQIHFILTMQEHRIIYLKA